MRDTIHSVTNRLQELGVLDSDADLQVSFETTTDFAKMATHEMMQKLDYEARGAWRTGYEWLHVYRNPDTAFSERMAESFTATIHTVPTMDGEPRPTPDTLEYQYSLDLREMDDIDMEEYR